MTILDEMTELLGLILTMLTTEDLGLLFFAAFMIAFAFGLFYNLSNSTKL